MRNLFSSTLTAAIVLMIALFLTTIGEVWVITSFILYCVDKIESFNWLSVGLTLFGYAVVIVIWLWLTADDRI